jgi:serine/threonine protein kinase
MHVSGEITYRRIRQIGVGQGMNSIVWLAHDPQRNGLFAVKEIAKANFGAAINQFFQEAQAMFAAEHQNVVRIDCAFQTTDQICLGMKYYPDGSLLTKIDPSPLGLTETLKKALGILSGVAHIHGRNYIHFDLKPSNILLSDRGVPMVADFGQTCPVGAHGFANRPAMYHEAMPPECYAGIGSIQSDIYQIGLLVYRMVNGEAFYGNQRTLSPAELEKRVLKGKFPNRNLFLPHVPRKLKTAIRKALMVAPDERFPSAPEFSDSLARVDVRLDWQTCVQPNGEIEWKAKRDGRPGLVVRLAADGTDWKTEVYTDGATLRRLNSSDHPYWENGLTMSRAMRNLTTVFESLEQQ